MPASLQPGPENNWNRDRPITELLSDTPEEVTIAGVQKRMLDHHHHVHLRIATPYTPHMAQRDIIWVVHYNIRTKQKVRNCTYSDTHTCKEIIELLNGAVINYRTRSVQKT